ncbi:MAG TPA: MFS transporter [Flavitalea sp.]|nr:MFS transporter [Flavitalea sp.]
MIFTLYRNAYSGLSSSTWWLSLIMLINRSGTMVVPFMMIYLIRPEMGFTIGEAGLVIAFFGLGAIAGGFLGGKLTDRIGFYPVQFITLTGGGLLFILLGQMKSYNSICVFTFLLSLVNEAFRPANSTAIVYYSADNNRTRSYALNRLAINLGWAVGSAVGGFLASINYELLFWVDGITNIMAALLMLVVLPAAKRLNLNQPKRIVATSTSAYRDKKFLLFIFLTILFAGCFFQMFNNINAYYKIELGFTERFIGLLGAVNGIIIVLVEMILIFHLEGKRTTTWYIGRGVFLCGLAFLMLNIFPMNHQMAILMMVLITFGEMLSMPFMNSFWISRTAEHNRGQYAGLYTIAWSIAQTCGPLFGSQIAQTAGFSVLWWIVAAVCMIAGGGFLLLNRS